jgi:hypothetical protein
VPHVIMDPGTATLAVGPVGVFPFGTPADFAVTEPSGLATVRLDALGAGTTVNPPGTPPDQEIGNTPGSSLYLGPPDAWLVINILGTDYQFPGYQ